MEALGITLFERIDSEDPTALIGLPLIWLAERAARGGLRACPDATADASRRLERIDHRGESAGSGALALNTPPVRPIEAHAVRVQEHALEAEPRSSALNSSSPYFSSPATGCPACAACTRI